MRPKKPLLRDVRSDAGKTADKAARLTASNYTAIPLQSVSDRAANSTPTPTHEPAMPAEVYYNKMALEETPDGESGGEESI